MIGAHLSYQYKGLRIDPLVRPTDVVDGLSNTILVGEKQLNRTLAGTANPSRPQPGDEWGWLSGFSTDTLRTGALPCRRDQTGSLDSILDGFGSAHSGGWWSLFADGSVRRLRNNEESGTPEKLSTLQRLCHRRDGGTISAALLE